MKKFLHYVSLNLISLSGYTFAFFLLIVLLHFYPQAINESLKNGTRDNFEVTVGFAMWIFRIAKIFFFADLILFFAAVAESDFAESTRSFCHKFIAAMPSTLQNILAFFFIVGIFLALIPTGIAVISFL